MKKVWFEMKTRFSKRQLVLIYFLLCIPCVFLSGHSCSLVVSSVVDVVMITIGFVICAILNPRIRLPRSISAEGGFIMCIAIGATISYVFYSNKNVWLDPLLVLGRIGLAYCITRRISFENYAKLYSNLMTVLSLIAIAILSLNEIGFFIPSYTYAGLDGRATYHTIWFCSWADLSQPEIAKRVMGPFWEPGLFSSMVIYALICEGCFTMQKPRKLPMAILLIGLFLSNSTAGYILAAVTIYIIFFKSKKQRILFDVITLLIIIVAYFFGDKIVEILVQWNPTVFGKLAEQSVTASTRLLSPIVCFLVFMQSPLTGLGMSYANEQYSIYKSVFNIDALTSTSIFMLAAFGIWGIAYTIFLCRGIWRQMQFGVTARLLLIAVFLMIVNKEPHTSILFTYIIMFYLNERDKRKENIYS